MRRMQLNLYRDEVDLKHCKAKRVTVRNVDQPTDPSLPWWKSLNIPKKYIAGLQDERSCVFCLSTENCEEKYGEFLHHPFSGMRMHYFCLLLSSGLTQTGDQSKSDDFVIDENTVCGFSVVDIVEEIKRASRLRCSFCRKLGASIGCVETSCKKKFHFNCGVDSCVLSQFYDSFRSYCLKHRPMQTIISRKSYSTIDVIKTAENPVKGEVSKCPICFDEVTCSLDNFHILTTPCCGGVWLHRGCVQQQASSAGLHFFRCPVCNDSKVFAKEMLRMGIYVPERDASWELTHDAFSELLQRHSQCDKESCVCPHGRDYNSKNTKWEIVLCDLCGSSGTHVACDEEVSDGTSYYCCCVCLDIHGKEGSRKLAQDMGIPTFPVRRSRRVRQLDAVVSERPKRLKIDMVC